MRAHLPVGPNDLLLIVGEFLPTRPLAITAAEINELEIIATDAIHNLSIPFEAPFHKKRRLPSALRTFHQALAPSGLLPHNATSFL
jgi:hypothetical protein